MFQGSPRCPGHLRPWIVHRRRPLRSHHPGRRHAALPTAYGKDGQEQLRQEPDDVRRYRNDAFAQGYGTPRGREKADES